MEHSNFIRTIIEDDLKTGKHDHIVTRFPPEPNGFLHLGHARSIIMNYTLAKDFGGTFNLRFDDTNPVKEDATFIEAIQKDIEWLGCHWDALYFASDYFETMYKKARLLIQKGKAYVDDQPADVIRATRGDLKTPGQNSPYRDRTVEENLSLFEAMRAGEFKDGEKVLRAKVDMASPNMNMRDPVIYRIQHAHHHRTKDEWCIYPMYDFAHPLEDAIEGITHSLCTLEFEDHRPIYDWVVKECEMESTPRQIEFGKLKMANEISGKRFINALVMGGTVDDYADPRLVTLSGLRQKGVPVAAIHRFIHSLGLPKSEGETSLQMLEEEIRSELSNSPRIHLVKDPLLVTITNYPSEGEILTHAADAEETIMRDIPFSNQVFIERDDFVLEKPNKKWKRLALGIEVRLMHAYFIKAESVVTDEAGKMVEIKATYDVKTKSGTDFNERKPNGNIHFVDAKQGVPVTYTEYEPLLVENADRSQPLESILNPDSIKTYEAVVEPAALTLPGPYFQAIRSSYVMRDSDSAFHRVVALRSSFKG